MATTRASRPRTTKPKDPAKAVAEKNAAATEAEPTVEEKRERRAEIIAEINKDSQADQKEEIKEQEAAGQGAKIDDAGAIEQARVARESNIELLTELAGLEGPPVVAPIVEPKGLKVKLVSRREEDADEKGLFSDKAVTEARFVGNKLWLVGEGLPSQGEVIVDVRRANGSDHQRFSHWAETTEFQINLPGLSGIGDWLVHAEHLVTLAGEGREDGLQRILESNELKLSLR